ncbi:MAG: Mth938-like domain-containing protein [Pseudomonadota bacterium]
MRFVEITYTDAQPVDGYGPGFFRIAGAVHNGPLMVSPSGVRSWGGFEDVTVLSALADSVDVVFIGTGSEIVHVPAALRNELEDAGLGVEIMASPAACRTYNVLLSEGRRIALAVIPV